MRPMRGYDAYAPEISELGNRQPPLPHWQKQPGKRAEMARSLMAGHLQARIEAWAAQGAQDGIRYVYPLLDRRLIEFCLGAPGFLFAQPGQTRGLFREAMRGLLPEEIRTSSVKIESTRVSKLASVAHRCVAVEGPLPTPKERGSSGWLAGTRQIQVQAMRNGRPSGARGDRLAGTR
jgi:hypothetical protein